MDSGFISCIFDSSSIYISAILGREDEKIEQLCTVKVHSEWERRDESEKTNALKCKRSEW